MLTTMPFGKHKGTPITDLPKTYLKWLWNQEWVTGALRDAISEAAEKYTITKHHAGRLHSPVDRGWTGYYNPITGQGGSRTDRRRR